MAGFYGSICLSDIPRELISTGKNGKKYLNIEIGERRQPSQYGATHYVKASVKQEQKQEGVNYYIGDLKPSKYDNGGRPQDKPKRSTLLMKTAICHSKRYNYASDKQPAAA